VLVAVGPVYFLLEKGKIERVLVGYFNRNACTLPRDSMSCILCKCPWKWMPKHPGRQKSMLLASQGRSYTRAGREWLTGQFLSLRPVPAYVDRRVEEGSEYCRFRRERARHGLRRLPAPALVFAALGTRNKVVAVWRPRLGGQRGRARGAGSLEESFFFLASRSGAEAVLTQPAGSACKLVASLRGVPITDVEGNKQLLMLTYSTFPEA
jgi:hypothetical protein